MKLYNTLSKKVEEFGPLEDKTVRMYSCGPTVYDHVHIGNLRTYIFEDTLRRVLKLNDFKTQHVMNITDVDDKTIARSQQKYPDEEPRSALLKLTKEYEEIFYQDAKKVGIDFSESKIVKATEHVKQMQDLIKQIPNKYVTEDGIYFDITKYPDYGKLVVLDQSHTHHRIENDEYDKDHVADFALWKIKKEGEPSWPFDLEGKQLEGRPGWHIECSAMSATYLDVPFDIHTGGVDLKFPHHENEIAQTKAGTGKDLAKFFVHSEHLLVDGKKMSKSLQNFYTLTDIVGKGFDPLAFRLLILQSHYRSQLNFTWDSLEAAQNRLQRLRAWADLSLQKHNFPNAEIDSLEPLLEDLGTPTALARIDSITEDDTKQTAPTTAVLEQLDQIFGLGLSGRGDISEDQRQLISKRENARKAKDFEASDTIRADLEKQGIGLNDTAAGPIWFRL